MFRPRSNSLSFIDYADQVLGILSNAMDLTQLKAALNKLFGQIPDEFKPKVYNELKQRSNDIQRCLTHHLFFSDNKSDAEREFNTFITALNTPSLEKVHKASSKSKTVLVAARQARSHSFSSSQAIRIPNSSRTFDLGSRSLPDQLPTETEIPRARGR